MRLLAEVERMRRYATVMCNAHYSSSHAYERRRIWLGLPTVALSTVVGTSVFGSLANDFSAAATVLTGAAALAAAVLAALQTFLDFATEAARHKEAAVGYETARHLLDAIERRLSFVRPEELDTKSLLDELDAIDVSLTEVAKSAPTVADRTYETSKAALSSGL